MMGLYFVIGAAILFFIYNFIKSLSDPDVREASDLKMNVNHYRKYKEIYDEQTRCHAKNATPPNRMSEIPNMNEWRRYGEYRWKKSSEELYDSIK